MLTMHNTEQQSALLLLAEVFLCADRCCFLLRHTLLLVKDDHFTTQLVCIKSVLCYAIHFAGIQQTKSC
jgi:hypothetical protein